MTQRIAPHLFSAGIFFCLIGLIIYPEESLDASSKGLELWWTIIFPSLLPFFILADLLPRSNWTYVLGRILEPVMRPVFNVSGQGALVLLLGFSSGFPVGAKLSVQLYNDGKISLADAQRLVCFTNGASPIFIMGAIAAGMLHTPSIGLLLLLAHYLGNILIGMLAGRMISDKKDKPAKRPFKTLSKETSFGGVLQTAVATSVQQLLIIGGLIIFFSVISTLASKFQLFNFPLLILNKLSEWMHLSNEWTTGFLLGVLEISNGTAHVAQYENDFMIKCVIVLAIISFGGFCIHAQIIACIHQTDIKYSPFFLFRLLHMVVSPVIFILFVYLIKSFPFSLPLLGLEVSKSTVQSWPAALLEWFITYGPFISIGAIMTALAIMIKQLNDNKKAWR
ncbi:sporulation integral membrane protein YlbJ [Jeotgalibacillus sp. S-D1]|uniref:sporulation integral membrane protein YlbJ n=1 Tax=Jeotgalibacillus sp. S-D1 TaxID=2552189 RepID=UPI001059F2BB|nr:sporulation integral membrane protein YlbJ [Jeotgalibacillus sp. S-D1]TDL35143.1 sporulation integral membrane protein YlbJ [Jeotgalibacillus sp. S-D1]